MPSVEISDDERSYVESSAFSERYGWIASDTGRIAPEVICELGARTGLLSALLRRDVSAIKRVHTVDIDPMYLDLCSARGFVPHRCDFNREPIPIENETVDLVLATEVFEHLHNYHFFASEVARILRQGGYAVVTVPNVARLRNRIKLLFGRDILNIYPPGETDVHIREFTAKSLKSYFGYHSLVPERIGFIAYRASNPFPRILKAFFPSIRGIIYVLFRKGGKL